MAGTHTSTLNHSGSGGRRRRRRRMPQVPAHQPNIGAPPAGFLTLLDLCCSCTKPRGGLRCHPPAGAALQASSPPGIGGEPLCRSPQC